MYSLRCISMGAQGHLGKRKEVGHEPENRVDTREAQPEQWQRDGEKLRYFREIWEIESTMAMG